MRTYRGATFLVALGILVVGVAMLASTIARGGGPLATGVILGTLLAVFGALRMYLVIKTGPTDPDG